MHDWLGIALFALGLGLIGSAIMKRHNKLRNPIPAGQIRPEFAAMGEIVRPLILFAVAIFAGKMALFYFVLGGRKYLTPLDFAGLMFVLAAYVGWLIVATRKPVIAPAGKTMPAGERSVA